VVSVDVQITLATQDQVNHRMPGKEGQHVIEERNACFDRGFA